VQVKAHDKDLCSWSDNSLLSCDMDDIVDMYTDQAAMRQITFNSTPTD